ncbi:MAG: TonB-dependent receptor [Flavobacteriales bacterium]|nr:TonB-dependent receptor [Flavobacteriales bacterium]
MKKIFLFLFSISAIFCLGQEIKILDSMLNTPIENVNLICKEVGVSTNKNGMVNISLFKETDSIQFTHLSYHNKKIIFSDISKIVYLSAKTKVLPTINFKEAKIPLLGWTIICQTKKTIKEIVNKSTAELLSVNSGITIQENQAGGGSPNFRGMEANRLLLVVDDIPLNNAIYRSGHLQSSSTINPFFIGKVNLLSGPASVAYGNGAMGGALLFYTKSNLFKESSLQIHQQYESATNAVMFNFLSNYHAKKLAFTSGFSIKSVGNLKMGKNRLHKYINWGKESFATKGQEQLFTSFQQVDFMHKILYLINENNGLLINSQYSTSSDISRFDKMNDEKDKKQKYSDWYYGPQNRFLQSISWSNEKATIIYDGFKSTMAYQNVKESRHQKKTEETLLSNRYENVNIYDFLLDFNKEIVAVNLAYGIGTRHQNINSTANLSDSKNATFYNPTRYPSGGSTVNDYFAYSQLTIPFSKKIKMLLGGRLNQYDLIANFTNPTFSFTKVRNKNSSFIKSALLSYKISRNTTISSSYYGGFRNPNVDDIGKVFSKNDKDVIVPNDKLEPEYANNLELTINYKAQKLQLQIEIYNTKLSNAISREYGSLNGADSMLYDGELMRIQMNKNIESATINGISLLGKFYPNNSFTISANCNYLKGRNSNNKPLAHIPPLNATVSFAYLYRQQEIEFYCKYNAWKKQEDYDIAGVDNLEEATIDGTPMWYTLNLHYSYKIDETLTIGIGLENMMNIHYKTFASGISASGRNFILSLHSNF